VPRTDFPSMSPFAVLISKISAGELGIQADVLEERLSRIFQLAHHWNAVLLLDEADVYLEQRVRQDIARNGLVAVFIRSLSSFYYTSSPPTTLLPDFLIYLVIESTRT
jgi:hypothetical protein